jgi:hypothetical protein
MTRPQLWILTTGVFALFGCLLFPPWVGISEWADGHVNRDPCQRYFVLTPPTISRIPRELQALVDERRRSGAVLYQGPDQYVIDWGRQIIPISVVTAATLVGLVILRRRA